MLFIESVCEAVSRVLAGRFSGFAVGGIIAAFALSLFAAAENRVFNDWQAAGGHNAPHTQGAIVQTADDDFSRALSSASFWRKRGGSNASKYVRKAPSPNGLLNGGDGFFDPFFSARQAPGRVFQSGLHRTVCVRLCDGYFWPISFSTTASNFAVDENICKNASISPARLFTYLNPGEDIDKLRDREGNAYRQLTTAFRYQQQYVNNCKSRPHPWEAASLERHQRFAELAKQGKRKLNREIRRLARPARTLSRRRASIGYIEIYSSDTAITLRTGEDQPAGTSRRTSVRVAKAGTASKRRHAGAAKPKWTKQSAAGIGSGSSKYRPRRNRAFKTAFDREG